MLILVWFGLVVAAVVGVVVVTGGRGFRFVIGFVVEFVGSVGCVGLALAGAGFLMESFPVSGIDGVRKSLHCFE